MVVKYPPLPLSTKRHHAGGTIMFLQRAQFLSAILLVLVVELGCGSGHESSIGQQQQQPADFAYVLNNNPIGNSASTTLRVSDDSVVRTESAGIGSVSEVISGTNASELFIANNGDDSVTEYSLIVSPNPVKISLPSGAHPVTLASTTSNRIFSMNAGATAGCPAVGSVSAIDTAALAVVSTTCVGQAGFGMPSAIAQLPNGGKVYVLAGAVIYVLDPSGSTVLTTIEDLDIVSPWSPNAITPSLDGTYVFVLDKTRILGRPHSGGIWIITTSNDTLSSSPIGGGYPDFSVLDTHLNRLYVADSTSNTVSVFDASKVNLANNPAMPTLATVNVGSGPVGVAALPDGTKFYVANGGSNDVTVVDASSFQVLTTVTVGEGPAFIQSEPTSSKIYVADQKSSDVTIIATSGDTISATINSPPQDPTCTSSCALQTPVMIVAH